MKWRTFLVLSLAELLAMAVWFSASAVIPALVNLVGWEWTFAFLAIGPAVGIWATQALRRLPDAAKLAGGKG